MTTITKERLLKIQQWSETYGAGSNVMLPAEEAEELARIALASLEAEPVASCIIEDGHMCVDGFCEYVDHSLPDGTYQLYTAPPASEREQIRRKTEPVAYLVCNGRLYQDRPFLDLSTARKSVKDRNDGAEIKALCVCEISAEK
ncbi:hypothetical protein EEN90_19045 [Salmonella enterica]|nr:hypothetical protein [Salmonella enterica]EDU1961046.1 hypothetical protein [Salmonella enterica subsp. arizonae serovar 53:z4,z23:-]EKG3108323.1 hypothetical protein [Salmonella enterica]ELX2566589.1 hypothetical protein [Salmonella enterica]MFK53775.1 hypothetical protein [Salmonella enterica]